jgi:hypothetical protein
VSRTAAAGGTTLGGTPTGTQRAIGQPPLGRAGATTDPHRAQSRTAASPPPGQRPMPLPRPDLALGTGSVRVSPPSGPPGQTVSVLATVTNVGAGPSRGAVVAFQVRGARGVVARGAERIGAVPSRGRAGVRWSFPMPAAGSWRVEVTVQEGEDANPANDGSAVGVTSVAPRIVPRRPAARPGRP